MTQAQLNLVIAHGNVYEVASALRSEVSNLSNQERDDLISRLLSLLLPEED